MRARKNTDIQNKLGLKCEVFGERQDSIDYYKREHRAHQFLTAMFLLNLGHSIGVRLRKNWVISS